MLVASEKTTHVLHYLNIDDPALAGIRAADDPAAALVRYLADAPRARFRFEWDRKADMLAFLREHYAAWRHFDTAVAERLCAMTVEEAQGFRALTNIAELGKAWWATGDPRYGSAFQRFYLAAPTGDMCNWGDFIGSQGCYELDAYFLLQDCPAFTTEGRIAFLDHLHASADMAWDSYTSRWQQIMLGPEGHNWYLHGMHVLPFVGLLFPAFARSPFFVRSGMSVVEEHVRAHYKADGGARETCPAYQSYSLANLWDLYLIARRNEYPVSAGMEEALLQATRFLLRLQSPQGGLPSFGDGRHTPGWMTRVAAMAVALTGDPECKWYAEYCRAFQPRAAQETPGELPFCALWDVGLDGAALYARTPARQPAQCSILLGETGYAALRDAHTPEARYMAIAAADRGTIVTSHGHNDIFSLEVHAGGVRFIGEMGCAEYGNSPARQYDEKTEAHTCLTIDGMEQVPLVNEWRWEKTVVPHIRRWISEPTHDFFHGVHEGYYTYPERQALHARKVFFIKSDPAYWVVMDWLDVTGEHEYRAYFHGCVPGCLRESTLLLGEEGGARLAVIPADGSLTVSRVTSDGLTAYLGEKKLDPERHPCYTYEKRASSDGLAWLLAPLAPGEPLPRISRLPVCVNGVEADAHSAVALEIAFPGHTDRLCVSHKDYDMELRYADRAAWGMLAFERVAADGTVTCAFVHTMADGVSAK